MPPKKGDEGAALKAKHMAIKTNAALEKSADVDLKLLLDNCNKVVARLGPESLQVFSAFIKRARAELVAIRENEMLDPPAGPLFVCQPIDYPSLRAFLGALEPYPWLRVISLHNAKIGDDGAQVLAEFLGGYAATPDRNPFGIEVLELPMNGITPRGAAQLGAVLAQNETVRRLQLDFNPLGDAGVAALGDGLKWNASLQFLSLQYCDIGPTGGEAVAKFFIRSSSVDTLSLRGNPLGPAGVAAIGRSLAKNAYLKNVDLADTCFGIDIEAVEALRDGVEGNETLESVNLDYNSVVPAGVQLLLETLKMKPKLVEFVVHERVGEAVYRDLLDTVAANQKAAKKRGKRSGGPAAAISGRGSSPAASGRG
jgi:Ran GTPase-activating protein (RanGAP) involved in mRNA processing and transport